MRNLRDLVKQVAADLEDSPADGEALLTAMQHELGSLVADPRWKRGDLQRWQEAIDKLGRARHHAA